MILELKLRKIGNSLGLVFPQEALSRLNVGQGDSLFLTESPEGGFRLTAADPEFARKLKAAECLSLLYRNALKELRKEPRPSGSTAVDPRTPPPSAG